MSICVYSSAEDQKGLYFEHQKTKRHCISSIYVYSSAEDQKGLYFEHMHICNAKDEKGLYLEHICI